MRLDDDIRRAYEDRRVHLDEPPLLQAVADDSRRTGHGKDVRG